MTEHHAVHRSPRGSGLRSKAAKQRKRQLTDRAWGWARGIEYAHQQRMAEKARGNR